MTFPQSVMIWAAMSSAGTGLPVFLRSTTNTPMKYHFLQHFMRPSADKVYGVADFNSQQDDLVAVEAVGE